MSLFSPNRLSTPTIKKFSSPNCAFGSRMSRDPRSNAETLLSMLFFDDCHCQAPPVSASADTAIRAAATRPATTVLLRRPRRGLDCAELRPRPTRDGCTRSRRRSAARSGTSEAYPATTGITSVTGSSESAPTASMTSVGGAGVGEPAAGPAARVRGGAASVPRERWQRRATSRSGRRPSHRRCGYRSAAPFSTSSESELPLRSHGAAPGDGRGLRVSHWLSPPVSGGPGRPGRPGVAFSPSLMFLPASDPLTIVRVGAHGRMQCLCLPLVRVAAFCGLRLWSQIRQDSYRTETT